MSHQSYTSGSMLDARLLVTMEKSTFKVWTCNNNRNIEDACPCIHQKLVRKTPDSITELGKKKTNKEEVYIVGQESSFWRNSVLLALLLKKKHSKTKISAEQCIQYVRLSSLYYNIKVSVSCYSFCFIYKNISEI